MVQLRAIPYHWRDILKDRRSTQRASYLIRVSRYIWIPLTRGNLEHFSLPHTHTHIHNIRRDTTLALARARPRCTRRKSFPSAHVERDTINPSKRTDGRTNSVRYRETPRKSEPRVPAGRRNVERAFRTRRARTALAAAMNRINVDDVSPRRTREFSLSWLLPTRSGYRAGVKAGKAARLRVGKLHLPLLRSRTGDRKGNVCSD